MVDNSVIAWAEPEAIYAHKKAQSFALNGPGDCLVLTIPGIWNTRRIDRTVRHAKAEALHQDGAEHGDRGDEAVWKKKLLVQQVVVN